MIQRAQNGPWPLKHACWTRAEKERLGWMLPGYGLHRSFRSGIALGCLAGSRGRACDSWSQGFEFVPHNGCRDNLTIKSFLKNLKTGVGLAIASVSSFCLIKHAKIYWLKPAYICLEILWVQCAVYVAWVDLAAFCSQLMAWLVMYGLDV